MSWPQPFTQQRTLAGLHVAEAGSETGAPVLFLHGNPDTHAVWATTVERLPELRCIAPDLPGFGRSAAPDDLSLAAQGEAVHALVTALGVERIHLVAHDVGGMYGLAFAALHPGSVASLTIFNTVFSPDYRWHFWGRVWRTRVLGELAMKLGTRGLFVSQLRRGSATIPIEYANLAFAEFTPATKRHVLRYYRAMDPENYAGWDTRLVAAKLPTQVIWGDADPFIPTHFADRFGGVVHHEPHGHWVMAEDPERAASLIRAHVTAHS